MLLFASYNNIISALQMRTIEAVKLTIGQYASAMTLPCLI